MVRVLLGALGVSMCLLGMVLSLRFSESRPVLPSLLRELLSRMSCE